MNPILFVATLVVSIFLVSSGRGQTFEPVREILAKRCHSCHGEEKQKAGLRLDVRAGVLEADEDLDPVVVAGRPEESPLFSRIVLPDGHDDLMPPEGGRLPEDEIGAVRAWILAGAPWDGDAAPATDVHFELPPGVLDGPPVDFDRDVRPLLADACFACHGPDASHRAADLRLDRRGDAVAERRGGAAVVPLDAAASLVTRRIFAPDPEVRMPPPETGKELDESSRAIIARWIAQGAEWKEHWAFVAPPRRPLPRPVIDGWARNPIDLFVAGRLESEGLTVSPRAAAGTLARRLALDLTGLPPDPADVRALRADPSDAAVSALVDRLLASPAYGEHMARHWLDVARYSDTHGLHLDNYREMWPYRDWVIRAFADNMPYDRFVVEQLAGDLLPGATRDQHVASGFNRAHVTTNEGGSIVDEVRFRNVVDRTSTMGTAFLGLTLGCAVCHDHKFDPISQREFFSFYAFFNNLDGKAMDDNVEAPAPVIRVPSREQELEIARLEGLIADIEEEVEVVLAGIEYVEPEVEVVSVGPLSETIWIEDALPAGAELVGPARWVEEAFSGEAALETAAAGIAQSSFADAERRLRFGGGETLFVNVWLDPADPPREIMIQINGDGSPDGWRHGAYWGENLIPYGADATSERLRIGDLPPAGGWTRLEIPAAAIGLVHGAVAHGVAFNQYDGTMRWDGLGVSSGIPQEPVDRIRIDDDTPAGATTKGDGAAPWSWVAAKDGHPVRSGERSLRRSGVGLIQDVLTAAPRLTLRAGDRLFAWVWLDPADPPRGIQLQFHGRNGWMHRARWGVACHGEGAANGADFRAGDLPDAGEWVRLEVSVADIGLEPGDWIDGQAFTQVDGTVYWDAAGVRTWGPAREETAVSLVAWERAHRRDPHLPEEIREILATPPGAREAHRHRIVSDWFVRHAWTGARTTFEPFERRLAPLRSRLEDAREAVPTTLVMKERAEVRPTHVRVRGQYDQLGDEVERATPAMLPSLAADAPRDRLGLARWLVRPDHPLTARVAVNRIWQQLLGTGLVETSEDFGTQGARPSHPRLLDWLARRFVADGWDVKRMVKRIVTSATYLQDSRRSAAAQARDPSNRLLGRASRFRLDAEVLRDQALALSGLLVDRVGGPGRRPPQPEGLWRAVGYVGSNTEKFVADVAHEDIHRRSVYTFWKRTAPPPQMGILDAPSREACTCRRERTNTPLQALLLMNDPQYVEAARALARRVRREGGKFDQDRAAFLLESCTARPADAADVAEVVALVRAERESLSAEEAVGLAGASDADLAAWTMAASLVLNLDEVVTRE